MTSLKRSHLLNTLLLGRWVKAVFFEGGWGRLGSPSTAAYFPAGLTV